EARADDLAGLAAAARVVVGVGGVIPGHEPLGRPQRFGGDVDPGADVDAGVAVGVVDLAGVVGERGEVPLAVGIAVRLAVDRAGLDGVADAGGGVAHPVPVRLPVGR